jgi:hypothetical protein
MSTFVIKGINIFSLNDEIHSQIPIIAKSPKFLKFINSLNKDILNNSYIKIHSVKWFYDSNNPVLYMELFTLDKQTNKSISELIFLKGDTNAIYVRIIYKNKKYIVLTKQLRTHIGYDTLELPECIIDTNKTVKGPIIQEICITAPTEDSLIPLGDFMSSPGNCDEYIKLFFFEVEVDEEKFNKIQYNTYEFGLIPEEEYEDILNMTKDPKAIIAHNFAKEKGLIM